MIQKFAIEAEITDMIAFGWVHFGNSHSSNLLKQNWVTPVICQGRAGFCQAWEAPGILTREAGKDHWGSLGGTREAPGKQERTYWTDWEAPGSQERTKWTAWEAPGKHQGGRKNLRDTREAG